MAALPAIISASTDLAVKTGEGVPVDIQTFSAYQFADSMLAAREK
jgi:hypothetical protein